MLLLNSNELMLKIHVASFKKVKSNKYIFCWTFVLSYRRKLLRYGTLFNSYRTISKVDSNKKILNFKMEKLLKINSKSGGETNNILPN